jgi:hypothetical protein
VTNLKDATWPPKVGLTERQQQDVRIGMLTEVRIMQYHHTGKDKGVTTIKENTLTSMYTRADSGGRAIKA